MYPLWVAFFFDRMRIRILRGNYNLGVTDCNISARVCVKKEGGSGADEGINGAMIPFS